MKPSIRTGPTCIICIIDSNTHGVGGISTLDFTLARRITGLWIERRALDQPSEKNIIRCANSGEVCREVGNLSASDHTVTDVSSRTDCI